MNLHTHTIYCDGKADPILYAQKAQELNWAYLGYSAHAPLPFDTKWAMKYDDVKSYSDKIKLLKNQYSGVLQIWDGWEVDFLDGLGIPAMDISEIAAADFIITSIHFLPSPGNYGDHFFEIDSDYQTFNKAIQVYDNSLKAMLDAYLRATDNMLGVQITPHKIIGHVDKIVLNAELHPSFKLLQKWFYGALFDILTSHNYSQQIVEINTRGIYNKKREHSYPPKSFAKDLQHAGIPIMLNSDAHNPNELNGCFEHFSEFILPLNQFFQHAFPVNKD